MKLEAEIENIKKILVDDENKRKLKFLTDIKYQNNFEQTVLKKIIFLETKNIEKDFKDNKYLQNAHYLKLFILEKIDEHKININNFVTWFYENVVLTVITCPSQDSAIQIFNVLNDSPENRDIKTKEENPFINFFGINGKISYEIIKNGNNPEYLENSLPCNCTD